MINCKIDFSVKNPKLVYKAIAPELASEVGRSKTKFKAGKKLECNIISPDITSFRAAVNNYLRLIHSVTKVIENDQ